LQALTQQVLMLRSCPQGYICTKLLLRLLARPKRCYWLNSYCGWYGETSGMCKDIKWESAHDKLMIVIEFGEGALQGLDGKENERWTE